MTFLAPHMYMTVIGDAYSSTETWQFGLRLSDGGLSAQATALAAAATVQKWWVGTAAPYSSGISFASLNTHRLTELKVARIGVDGKYEGNTTSYSHFYVPPVAGTLVASPYTIPQGTIAVTLTTAVPRGYASKGRVFLPPSQRANLAADGRMSTFDAQAITDSFKIFLNELNGLTEIGNVQVMSRGKGTPHDNPTKHRYDYTYDGPGFSNNVIGVRVGRVVDTQRRRRRALSESPVNAAL